MHSITWNPAQAQREGWDIFEVGAARAPTFQLQREDAVARQQAAHGQEVTFTSDSDVAAFVLNSACEGSDYHRDALAIVLGTAEWVEANGRKGR